MKNKSKASSGKDPKISAKKAPKKKNWLWELLSSVKLAVVVIFLIAVACILGTFIVQGRNTSEYTARYGKFWTAIVEGAQFNDVFHSYWFSVLLLLLCVNLFVCAVKRWRNTILQLGFLATHLSMILIMVGCLFDGWFGSKGAVNMIEGQAIDFYYAFDEAQTKIPLDFKVLLEDFELEKHEPKFELITYTKKNDKERTISTEIGLDQKVAFSDYKVTVKKFVPNAELEHEAINTSKEVTNPAVFTKLYNSGRLLVEGWLIAKNRYWYDYKRKDVRFEYLWAENAEELEKLVAADVKEVLTKEEPKLTVILKDRNQQMTLPFKVGEHYTVANTEYHVQVEEYVKDFANKNLPIAQQTGDNQAANVSIHGPQGDESRWIFANYPDWDGMHATKYSNIKLVFEPAGSAKAIRHFVKLIQSADAGNKLVYLKDGKVAQNITWELGKPYDIGDTGVVVELEKFYPSFGMKQNVKQNDEAPANPAIYVETKGPLGNVSEWMFGKDERVWWYKDANLALLYKEAREMIKDFKSTLTVIEDGKPVMTKVIEVNSPLSYKGIDFYQANYDPNNPKFSGIQISSHPGIAIVYSGFIILCIGITFIFYVKPLIKNIRKKKRELEKGGNIK